MEQGQSHSDAVAIKTETGTDDSTTLCSMGKWKGEDITVSHQDHECPIDGHALEVMHHYGDKGEHYCPTMFLYCPYCGGVADEPEPFECERWGV